MKFLNIFFILFFSFSLKAETLKLPVCNTKFIIGATVLVKRTFHGIKKKRIDTIIQNIPQSVIINYEKQVATWVWPRTYSYLSVPLNKKTQEDLKKATNIIELKRIKSDYLRGFEVDLYKLKANLPDGTSEESTRWITKQGVTLKEVGFIKGKEGKIHFYSEFSNVKMFKQDDKLFEVPEGFKIAPIEDLDDVNELLKLMVKRS